MYDFYPEWGPARNRDEQDVTPTRRPRYWQADPAARRTPAMGTAGGPDARDADRQRPDDN